MNRITNKKENSDTTTLHRHSHRRARPHGPDRLQFELDAVDHGGRTPTARRHFRLTTGADSGSAATGSYFQMIEPGGTVAAGPFFSNPDSTATNKAYTFLTPGTSGGLVTGKYQPNPDPAFDGSGNALVSTITQPTKFVAVEFGLSTNSTDPQSGKPAPAPTISVQDGKLSGQVRPGPPRGTSCTSTRGLQARRDHPGPHHSAVRHVQLVDPRVRDHLGQSGGRRSVQRVHRMLAPRRDVLRGNVVAVAPDARPVHRPGIRSGPGLWGAGRGSSGAVRRILATMG